MRGLIITPEFLRVQELWPFFLVMVLSLPFNSESWDDAELVKQLKSELVHLKMNEFTFELKSGMRIEEITQRL